jgi:hypothetical protein
MTDFPSSPLTGDEYTENGITYIFDGTKWKPSATKYSYSGSAITPVSGISTIDLNTGNFFELDISEQTEVQISNPPPVGKAQKFYLKLGVDSGYQDINGFVLSTASYDNISITTSPISRNIDFKSDGTKVYLLYPTQTTDRIYQYSLSSPWDLETLVYDEINLNVSSQQTAPQGYYFKPDGTILYLVGYGGQVGITQYNLPIAWSLQFASYSKQISLSSQDGAPRDIFFKPDGSKMYFVGSGNDKVYQYSLSTPWDIDTLTYEIDFQIFTPQQFSYGLEFNNDGTKMFVLTAINDTIHEYDLSTAWDLSTASYNTVNLSVNSQDSSPAHFGFKSDGTKLYMVGASTNRIYQYSSSSIDTNPNITWPTSFQWETGSAPTLPELGQTDLIEVTTSDGGTTYYAKLAEDNIS